MQHCGSFDANNESFAIDGTQDGSYIAKGQWEGEPDGQAEQGQKAEDDKDGYGDKTTHEQEGMETLPEFETKAYRQGLFVDSQVVLVIAHIVHVQDSSDQETDRNTGCESRP